MNTLKARVWKLLLACLLAPGVVASAQGEWVAQYSEVRIVKLVVRSPQVVWAVGEGKILVTPDGGANWLPTYQEDEKQETVINDIMFIDDQNAWAVGSPGVVLQTAQSGREWNQLREVGRTDFRAVYFRDLTTGWVGGADARLLTTNNGGQNWSSSNFQLSQNSSAMIRAITMVTATDALMLVDHNLVVVSNNEGQDWRRVRFPAQYNLNTLISRSGTVWLAGGRQLTATNAVGLLMRSDDFGQTWHAVSSVARLPGPITSLFFADTSTIYLTAQGKVYVSRDEGESWTEFGDGSLAIERIYGADDGTLWGLSDGTIYHYSTTGATAPTGEAPSSRE